MCIFSACGQIVYGLVMIACMVLTAIPTFNGKLFSWKCLSDLKNCDPFEKVGTAQHGYMKTVAIFMALALAFEMLSIIFWTRLYLCEVYGTEVKFRKGRAYGKIIELGLSCACCCKKYIIHPLTILSFITTVFLLVAVIVYAVNNKDDLGNTLDHKDQFGYSFWLSACALVSGSGRHCPRWCNSLSGRMLPL
ncbi:hypothetical protein OSTOST_17167, partial [Ostertagia ostertagi]